MVPFFNNPLDCKEMLLPEASGRKEVLPDKQNQERSNLRGSSFVGRFLHLSPPMNFTPMGFTPMSGWVLEGGAAGEGSDSALSTQGYPRVPDRPWGHHLHEGIRGRAPGTPLGARAGLWEQPHLTPKTLSGAGASPELLLQEPPHPREQSQAWGGNAGHQEGFPAQLSFVI